MAVIKVPCPKCGQKVSGDETFYGKSFDCPICTAEITFPEKPDEVDGKLFEDFPSPPKVDETPSLPPGTMVPDNDPFEDDPDPNLPPADFDDLPASPIIPVPPAKSETPEPEAASAPTEMPHPAFADSPLAEDGESPDAENAPTNTLGIIALSVGILNTISLCVGGLILAPITVVLGHLALGKAKQNSGVGRTPALVGVILGYAGLIGTLIALALFVVLKKPIQDRINSQNFPDTEAIEEEIPF